MFFTHFFRKGGVALLAASSVLVSLSLSWPSPIPAGNRTLESFKKGNIQEPYDREKEAFTPIVDSHLHFRPFGGKPIPYQKLLKSIERTSVRFVNVYGIGQRVPIDSDCKYYLHCIGTPVLPTIKNDMANAENYILDPPEDLHLTVSMTFPDLANPEPILSEMALLDKEYPGVFKWMGEVNLVKQALLGNHHEPADLDDIPKWAPFMQELRERNMPINIHCDLGKDCKQGEGKDKCREKNTQFQYLMEAVLDQYPNNKIVWAHMGLSRELANMNPDYHIEVMTKFLKDNPNLMLDITWSVLEEEYFSKHRKKYAAFINTWSSRFLPGTDFVASKDDKDFESYRKELEKNSLIHKALDDEAFRNIVLGNNYFKLLGLDYEAPPIKR